MKEFVYMKERSGHRWKVSKLQKLCRGYVVIQNLVDQLLNHWPYWVTSYSTWYRIFSPPKGGHQDDVSFLKAFLVDSILTERKVNMGYIFFWHMKASSLSEDSVLPYDMFITKIVKYFNVNLRNETNRKQLKSFDTYNAASLRRMHFVRKKYGS